MKGFPVFNSIKKYRELQRKCFSSVRLRTTNIIMVSTLPAVSNPCTLPIRLAFEYTVACIDDSHPIRLIDAVPAPSHPFITMVHICTSAISTFCNRSIILWSQMRLIVCLQKSYCLDPVILQNQDFPRMSHRIGLRMFMEIQIFSKYN